MTDPQKPSGSLPGLDSPLVDALVRSRRFFTKGGVSDDLRTVTKVGGRQADDFYRDRWSHDKVCLLYTSPSPRDRTRSRMPSSA